MYRTFISILFALTFFAVNNNCLAVRGLGESLLLEGNLALQRGEAWLLSCQSPDGSWQNDPALTAQAGMLLANSDASYYSENLRSVLRWLLANVHRIEGAGDFAQVLRLPIRLQSPELAELLKKFQQAKSNWDLSAESLLKRQWLLETHFLLPSVDKLLSAAEVFFLQEAFFLKRESHPAFALLALLCVDDFRQHEANLRNLRTACLGQAGVAEADMLFWIVRSLRSFERVFPVLDTAWRAGIVARILAKQRGYGGFSGDGKRVTIADLSVTVFYLQTLQLCLAP